MTKENLLSILESAKDKNGEIPMSLVRKAFEQLPSAQTEIIRCTDCKWYEGDIMANPWGVCCHPSWVDGNSGHEVAERGWCYRAERREE